jgi:hypothetical protein
VGTLNKHSSKYCPESFPSELSLPGLQLVNRLEVLPTIVTLVGDILHDQWGFLPLALPDDDVVAVSLGEDLTVDGHLTTEDDHVEEESTVQQDATSSIQHECRIAYLDAVLLVKIEAPDIEKAECTGQPVLATIGCFDVLPERVVLAQESVHQAIPEHIVPVNGQRNVPSQVFVVGSQLLLQCSDDRLDELYHIFRTEL